VRREWDRGFEAAGTTAHEVRERIEAARSQQRETAPLEAAGPDRGTGEIMKQASGFLTDREAVFDRAELLKTAVQISGGRHSIEELNAALAGPAGRENGLERMGRETHGWQAGKEFYTTRQMRELEARNIDTLRSLPAFKSVTSRAEVEAYLAGLAGEGPDSLSPRQAGYLAAYRAGQGAGERGDDRLSLSEGQRRHVLNELTGGRGFSITQGDPGTGKTFAAGIVERFNRDVLEPSGRKHYTLNVAYTGKAALEMSQASGKPAYTVDSFLSRFHDGKIGIDFFPEIGPEGAWQKPTAGENPARLPAGVQVVIKVDEASFVGGRQAEHLLRVLKEIRLQGVEVKLAEIGDRKQMQSIQASPFFAQASELARQGFGDYAAMKEISRQRSHDFRNVAQTLNRDGDRQQLGTNAKEALAMLQDQGRVTEISERRELIKATVSYYLAESSQPSPDPVKAAAGEKRSVLLVTPLNLDRQELNAEIRNARLRSDQIKRGRTFDVLTQVRQGVTVASLKPGMTIVFSGYRGEDGRMKAVRGSYLNQQGQIQSVNPEKNSVTVRFGRSAAEKGNDLGGKSRLRGPKTITRTFDAAELAGKTTLYQRDQREFSQGDRILFGRNTRDQSVWSPDGKKGAGVRNGEMGEIEELSTSGDNTVALVRLDDGRSMNVHLDRFGPQQIDYGYAVTIHKGQGGTVDSVVPFHYVQPGAENDRTSLESVAGVTLSETQFRQWNAALSDFERDYRARVRIGEHGGDLGFVMIRDQRNNEVLKGVALRFHDGNAMMTDEETRMQLREAGMYWSPDIGCWITGVTNDRAMGLMDHHPLKDATYSAQLKTEFAEPSGPGPGPGAVKKQAAGERNFQAEVDTTADAEQFGRASYNAFNVAITRARYEAMVFTNSVSGLQKTVLSVDEKTTTVDSSLYLKIAALIDKASLHVEQATDPLSRDISKEIQATRIMQTGNRGQGKDPAKEAGQTKVEEPPKVRPGIEMER
jgi:hypothetical protein